VCWIDPDVAVAVMFTVYVPAGVPGFWGPVVVLLLLPPHAV